MMDLKPANQAMAAPQSTDPDGLQDPLRGESKRRQWIIYIISVSVGISAIAVWQWFVTARNVSPFLLPKPSDVVVRLRDALSPGPASYYSDIWTTFQVLIIAFVISATVGTIIGMVLAQSEMIERVLFPYIFAFQSIPKIAIAPLIIIWSGFGMTGMIAVAVVVSMFSMIVSALAGFKSVPVADAQMFRGLCASGFQTFFKLKVPAALPMLFAGFNLCLIYSLLGTILGEFIGGQAGLGVRILIYNASVDVAGMFAVIVVLAVMAVLMHLALSAIRRRLLFWTPSAIAERSK